MSHKSGYFEIGVFNGKTERNIGTLWRSAYQLGASGIFTIGTRYKHQSSDTCKAYRHIPMRSYDDWDDFLSFQPQGSVVVGIEIGGIPLSRFAHPKQAIYILGAEDSGLPAMVIDQCQIVVSIEAVNTQSYNVAVAGSIIMYDRFVKGRHD